MNNELTFKTVLSANKDYVEAVKNNERAEVQLNLLKQCEILMNDILNRGLANEYREYCEKVNK